MDRETARRLIAEGLSPQKLSDEHEERLAELAAPVPVTEGQELDGRQPGGPVPGPGAHHHPRRL